MDHATESRAETLQEGIFNFLGKIPGSIIETPDLTVIDILI
jgi:hypothetical protein